MKQFTVRIQETADPNSQSQSYYLSAADGESQESVVARAFAEAADIGHGIGRCRWEIYPGHDGYYTTAEMIDSGEGEYDIRTKQLLESA